MAFQKEREKDKKRGMVGEEERKEERKEGSKEREKRKRKERERGRKGGKIDCRSLHIKLFMNFLYLQINSGALVWLPRLLMFPHLLPPFLSIFNILQHKTIFGPQWVLFPWAWIRLFGVGQFHHSLGARHLAHSSLSLRFQREVITSAGLPFTIPAV